MRVISDPALERYKSLVSFFLGIEIGEVFMVEYGAVYVYVRLESGAGRLLVIGAGQYGVKSLARNLRKVLHE